MGLLPFNKKNLSDADLLKRITEGRDDNSLSILFQRYSHLVYGLCLKYLKSREEAQDAVMDIYEKLHNSIHDQQISHFKSWLYTVSKNHCLMILRKSKAKIRQLDVNVMENGSIMHLEDEDQFEFAYDKLDGCLSKLKRAQQVCIKMFYLDQKSYQEICEENAYTLKQVKSYIQNGKRNLKICLEQNGQIK